jgi:hypothetical protein
MMDREYAERELREITDEVLEARLVLSEKAQAQEDMIVAARFAGMSLRAIAECCLCSHQTIANVLARSGAAEAGAAGASATTTPAAEPRGAE